MPVIKTRSAARIIKTSANDPKTAEKIKKISAFLMKRNREAYRKLARNDK